MSAFMMVAAACGGGAQPMAGVVAVTVIGMPVAPLAPMQMTQLAASATYSDGAVKDVTGEAAWESTDVGVIAVSPAGLTTAAGPGRADVSATFAGVRGIVTGEVVALPSAYLIDGLEYAFNYQLDAEGRVVSYRISQREGLTYPYAPTVDRNLRECTGSLRGSYVCSDTNWPRDEMIGQDGRLVSMHIIVINQSTSFTYSYGGTGLVQFGQESTVRGPFVTKTTEALAYDALGRLSEVRTVCSAWSGINTNVSLIEKTARITSDPQGRLMSEDVTTIFIPYPGTPVTTVPCPADTGTWTYDDAGRMKTAGSTVYAVDPDGWLTRRSRTEGSNTVVDTYAIIRFGGRVAQEQFTQAEPRAFYTARSDSQRVRYEWGRLPVEPTFVPRALTGLQGADYLGVISSHHR